MNFSDKLAFNRIRRGLVQFSCLFCLYFFFKFRLFQLTRRALRYGVYRVDWVQRVRGMRYGVIVFLLRFFCCLFSSMIQHSLFKIDNYVQTLTKSIQLFRVQSTKNLLVAFSCIKKKKNYSFPDVSVRQANIFECAAPKFR